MPKSGPFNAATAGKYNVFNPTRRDYAAFDTLTEAQADVRAQQTGVILTPTGQLDPTVQAWSGWSSFQSNFPAAQVVLNPATPSGATLPHSGSVGPIPFTAPTGAAGSGGPSPSPTLTAQRYNVWVPGDTLSNTGLTLANPPYSNGAFWSFGTAVEARAQLSRLGVGVLVTPQGQADPVQPWDLAGPYVTQLTNSLLQTRRVAGKVNVWIPPEQAHTLGVSDPTPYRSGGAFLPFDTAQEAEAHADARGYGLVLSPDVPFDPTAAASSGELSESTLKTSPVRNKVNVWIPADYVADVTSSERFSTGGYVGFDSVQQAQAFVLGRRLGVILEPKGDVAAYQPWVQSARYGAERLNPRVQASPPKAEPYVFFPPEFTTGALHLSASAFPRGGYLAFQSVAEAKAHVQARGFGVVLDAGGTFTVGHQAWKDAPAFAPPAAHWPPPPLAAEAQAPTLAGTADILGVYAKATTTGAHFVVRTHNLLPNETLRYQLYVNVNGTDMKLKDLGQQALAPNTFVNDAAFDVDYGQVNAILSVLQPGLQVTQGSTEFGVRVTWPNGHDQGAGGGGGRAGHRFPAP